jgi:ketosteroid isomerase-like protein
MPNPNTALVERIFGAPGGDFAPIDAARYLQSVADDVCYTIIGSTRFSGVARGRDEIFARIFAPLAEALDGGIEIAPDTIFGEGDLVAMQARGRARTKRGDRYDNTYCFVFRFRDGLIAEITEYLDTELVRAAL